MLKKIILLLSLLSLYASTCRVSFTGTAVDYNKLSTFSVNQFENKSQTAPATAGQQFSELLKNELITTTKLEFQNVDGDLSYEGAVTDYKVTSIAPQPGETIALQRLTVTVQVDCKNASGEDANWSQSFSRFEDFNADVNLLDVQDELLGTIYDQLIEDVMNRTFADW